MKVSVVYFSACSEHTGHPQGVFEHSVNFQWSDRLGGTTGKKPAGISDKISHSCGGNATFFFLCGWQRLGLSVHHGPQMSFCITSTLKNRLSVGREGFIAENNSPGLPVDPLLYLEVSFRKHSKPQNKVLIAEPLIKALKQPR